MKRIIALAALLPASAFAQEVERISYDHFDFNYLGTSWDEGALNLDGNGYTGRFSVEMREHMFIFGEYESWEFDNLDAGSTSKSLGIGSNWDIGEKWSLWGAVGVTSLDLNVGAGNLDDEAGLVAGGARWAVGEGFELRFGAEYAELTDTGIGDSTVSIGGDIYLTDVVALTIEVTENEDDVTNYLIGLRFYHMKDSSGYRQRR